MNIAIHNLIHIFLQSTVFKPLPLLIFGSLALIAAIAVLFLPETYGFELPQTIEESENFGT